MTQEVPLPSATVGRSLRLPVVLCVIIGGASIVLARHYHRADPPSEPPAPGMRVGSNSFTLAP